MPNKMQRYFPELFPSNDSARRNCVVITYICMVFLSFYVKRGKIGGFLNLFF